MNHRKIGKFTDDSKKDLDFPPTSLTPTPRSTSWLTELDTAGDEPYRASSDGDFAKNASSQA